MTKKTKRQNRERREKERKFLEVYEKRKWFMWLAVLTSPVAIAFAVWIKAYFLIALIVVSLVVTLPTLLYKRTLDKRGTRAGNRPGR
jgi:Flp pilus assembly protein TadB